MLRPYFFTLFFLVITQVAAAQVYKAYVTEDGLRTTDSSKATTYILYQKMDGDSAWSARMYDMRDTLEATGTFKDEQLTIPHGRFTFYTLIQPTKYRVYRRDPERKDSVMEPRGNFIRERCLFKRKKKWRMGFLQPWQT